jgi:hypothetical protein
VQIRSGISDLPNSGQSVLSKKLSGTNGTAGLIFVG